ncbi:MAG: hypothetical protein PHV37_01110 [Candidatus Gastranaerophilales bacterium]|nr:hypothetical protein [Candidatus Gastranaerophilales bacterium]
MRYFVKYFILISSLFFITTFFTGCTDKGVVLLPNPWFDCHENLAKAAKVAGFEFPLSLSNYQVKAMKDMIEITYPLDAFRNVTVRKSSNDNGGDISGDYNNYPINKEISLKNGVLIKIRGDKYKIYVMNMAASSGYYSAVCDKGMSLKEVESIYEVIAEAEAPKIPPEAFE